MRHGIVVCAFVLVAGLLLGGDLSAGSLEPPGPPAPTMKTISQVEARTPISSLPITIAAPGSYYLTGDLTGVSGQSGITITASHVTLDLNGFSLIGVPASGVGINAAAVGGVRHLVVRNGVIRNWGSEGLTADFSSVVVENVRLDSNTFGGLIVGSNSIVRNTIATGNGGNGITVGGGSAIIGCTAFGNAATGLVAGSNSAVSSSTATSNVTGISLSSGSTATDCTAQQNTTGISVSLASRVVHSVARANSVGIFGGDGTSVEECTVEGNTDDGIRVSSRSVVRGNLARTNTNDGIQATGAGNRIEENESTVNGTGIRVDGANNLVVKNSAYLNSNEFSIAANNKLGPVSADPATAGPWANFDL